MEHDPDVSRLDDLTAAELRVLGCLIEKEATTPDNYPLTLNSLRNACNQSTSRDPVVSYDDYDVESALASLRTRGLTRTVHSTSNRATKYRHVVPEVLGLESDETAVLAVLVLRGAQTVGELKQRCDRQHSFGSTDEVADVLERLAARDHPLVVHLERQPGQKDARWAQILSPMPVGGSVPDESGGGVGDPEQPLSDGEFARMINLLHRHANTVVDAADHLRLDTELGPVYVDVRRTPVDGADYRDVTG